MASKLIFAVIALTLFSGLADGAELIKRQRPGGQATEQSDTQQVYNRGALERPSSQLPRETISIPDRWRLIDSLGIIKEDIFDPYNQNTYKGDKPLHDDWFLNLSAISDTVLELRDIPTPVGPQTTDSAGQIDVIGSGKQSIFAENLILSAVYYKGDTIFRPPDYEYRFTGVANYNRVDVEEVRALKINPDDGTTRTDSHFGVQDLYVDKHLRNVSERFDFDSLRVGVQPFTADFRGFLFIDNPFGIRLFGTRDNNIYQYNLAWFRRIEKDTNSGLNDLSEGLRDDDVFVANLYRQDYPVLGFNSQAVVLHNRNNEDGDFHYDNNGFLVRPASLGFEQLRSYEVTYLGYNGDGHFGRNNLSVSTYFALGTEDTAVFTDAKSDISAYFAAIEYSRDYDWIRARFSFLYGSGDDDPFDDVSTGFDSVFENPLFAGADTSYWIRQPVGNIGGGGVSLSGRNGVLNSLRSSKDQGQSNFTNPGIQLLGFGMDFDLLPEWRVSYNLNYLAFATTEVLEAARNQGGIDREIGWDISVASIYRPFMTQNAIIRVSAAWLLPGKGYEQMFGDDTQYTILANLVLAY
jgi:hypothetical protein